MVKEIVMKQTEIGMLPHDWEVESIGNLTSKIIGGGTPSRIVKEYWNGKIPWMTVKDFTSFNPNFTQENITELGLKNSATRIVPAGNLIIATRIALGKIVKYNVDVTINQDLKTINLFPKIKKDYFIYSYRNIEEKIIEKGSGSTVLGLSVADLNSFRIPLPPLPEQEAIAEALSDADAWIESLEQLIAKKCLIKQGAMQELLSPKEDWEVKKLGEVTIDGGLIRGPFGGALKKEFFVKNGYKVYEQKNAIYKSVHLGKYFVDTAKFKELGRFEVKTNDFILSCSGTIGKLFRIPQIFQKGIINQALLIIRLNSGLIDFGYFGHIFQYDTIQSKIIDDTQGGAMKNLVGMSEFRNTEIPLPSLTEQIRIATILSDMDTELEALEGQLGKSRKVKQGMMQELLTGRTRLI
ncbi:type I restriction enzyme, S subunit [Pedobacter terrae]|uniref:Type I restriction enzyme, S subunit n=1 Tax=Pedobacter terrae TaxID=405671 RepID=A0A1G7PRV5_9SPHI|nr:restriction endonuclease subunit S [Pedobacter terrae]SDF89037.1 type I restriction enzyme, S subunit [Pedobacter terrae]